MKRFITELVVVLTFLFALAGQAQTLDGFVQYAPNSPMVFGHAPVHNIWMVGADVAFGKKVVEYVSTFTFIPGDKVKSFGLTPIGFRFNLSRAHTVDPFVFTDAGILVSTRPIPIPQATGLNFLVDFGAGIRLGRVSAGYKFFHVSNADTAPVIPQYHRNFNPGLDANVVFLSVRFR